MNVTTKCYSGQNHEVTTLSSDAGCGFPESRLHHDGLKQSRAACKKTTIQAYVEWRLERWLRDYNLLLLSQRTHVQFPAPMWRRDSQRHVISGYLTSSSAPYRHTLYAYTDYTYIFFLNLYKTNLEARGLALSIRRYHASFQGIKAVHSLSLSCLKTTAMTNMAWHPLKCNSGTYILGTTEAV